MKETEIKEERKLTLNDVRVLYNLIGSKAILKSLDLNERSREILEMKWGHCMPIKDVAIHFGVSYERALQVYQIAVRRLKASVILAIKKYEQMKLVFDEIENIKYKNEKLQEENELFKQKFEALSPNDKLTCGRIDTLKQKIGDLELSVRNYNALRYYDIHTVEELVQHSREDLFTIRNIGKQSIDEIEEVLKQHGLKLSDKNLFNYSHYYGK